MSQHASDNDAKTHAPEIVKATNRIEIVILILPLAAKSLILYHTENIIASNLNENIVLSWDRTLNLSTMSPVREPAHQPRGSILNCQF